MKKFKKLISVAATAALAITSLISGSSLSVSAETTLITNGGPYTGDTSYISTYMREDYFRQSAFEIQFKYDYVGKPTSYDGQKNLGYNDTFEFIVFDTNFQGWDKTTVGPAGVDVTSGPDIMPSTNTTYSLLVPISTIEEKLSTGRTPYAINLQTGNIGTSRVSIVSLKYIKNAYVQKEFTATGAWTKGTSSAMTVNPSEAAIVTANEWNIRVSAFDLSAWDNPTVEVTATYNSASNNVQAEILVPTGEYDYNGHEIYDPVVANYVSRSAGTYTYTTDMTKYKDITSFLACYDKCTVTEIHVYNKIVDPDPSKPEPKPEPEPEPEPDDSPYGSVIEHTADEIADNMGLVWNLGNALEAVDENGNVNEKAWGNPKTTKKLIQAVKAAGFNTVRVPVSYMNMIEDDYTINDAHMARIKQVVNYAYDMGMYVVIDIHGDCFGTIPGSWIDISKMGFEFEAIIEKFVAVWTDIADNFKDYDQRLVFEVANELMIYGRYAVSDAELAAVYPNINALNQAFINAVRAEGANNADRVLIVTGYNTNIDYTVNSYFVKPSDTAFNRLMLSVHYMSPDDFTLGWGTQWPTGEEVASNYNSKAYMEAQIARVSNMGYSLDMPIFLGEYGPENHSNNTEARANYCYWLNYYASSWENVVTAYWDNGVMGQDGTALFDRTNNVITTVGQTIVDAIIEGYNDGQW